MSRRLLAHPEPVCRTVYGYVLGFTGQRQVLGAAFPCRRMHAATDAPARRGAHEAVTIRDAPQPQLLLAWGLLKMNPLLTRLVS